MTITLETARTLTATEITPLRETPVERTPTVAESAALTEYNTPLYVTRPADPSGSHFVGSVHLVRATPSGDGWFVDSDSGLHRVYGAVVSEELQNGKYYRELTGSRWTIQYFDVQHADSRHHSTSAFNIIAANGLAWGVPNDSVRSLRNPYIEVTGPDGATPEATAAVEPAAVEPAAVEPMDAHQFMSQTTGWPLYGIAEETDGRVRLNPDPETNAFYLMWDPAMRDEADVCQRLTDSWRRIGVYRHGEYSATSFSTAQYADPATGFFAKVRTSPKDATDADLSTLRDELVRINNAFVDFNEATNDLAKEKEWCSEYESIIEPLGMSPRPDERQDYSVDVEVTFTFEDDTPPGTLDTLVQERHGASGLTIDNVRYTGRLTVSGIVCDMESEGDARDYIDTSWVQDQLDGELRYASDIEIDDWNISDCEPA